MKVLVTGANGYIGHKVTKKFLDYGCEVIATDLKDDNIDKRATVIKENIFSDKNYYELFGRPDACVHLAWRDGFLHNSSTHMLELSNHFRFLKSLIDSGIKKVAVLGSMHEIGYYEGAVGEISSTNPQSLYGIAKDALRRSLSLYFKDKEVMFQWLRAFYIYGDDILGSSIFNKIRQAVNEGKTVFPFTTGKNKFDFICIDDLSAQIVKCLMQDQILGEINVCSGTPKSLSEQVEWYIKTNNLPIKLNYGVYPDRPYDSPCIYGDSTKIKKILELFEERDDND